MRAIQTVKKKSNQPRHATHASNKSAKHMVTCIDEELCCGDDITESSKVAGSDSGGVGDRDGPGGGRWRGIDGSRSPYG